ncbi:MAG: DUF3124 domain-containing protein [Nitrospirota bacterium]
MLPGTYHKNKSLLYALLFAITLFPLFAGAETPPGLSSGETLYVPIYSNVYSGPKGNPFQLATMLSIHNIDPTYSLTLLKVDYYDSNGKFIESYAKKPLVLKPFTHTFYYLKEYDTRGGSGANFLVTWRAEKKINQPIVEALMLDTRAGLSFSSPGRVITKHNK